MHITQGSVDKIAIGLSSICAAHCLFLPFVLVSLPNIITFDVNNELIHSWILLLIVPFSFIGLYHGFKHHKKIEIPLLGIIGILTLIFAFLLSGLVIDENFEKILTLLGSSILVLAHLRNYMICRKLSCDCHRIF